MVPPPPPPPTVPPPVPPPGAPPPPIGTADATGPVEDGGASGASGALVVAGAALVAALFAGETDADVDITPGGGTMLAAVVGADVLIVADVGTDPSALAAPIVPLTVPTVGPPTTEVTVAQPPAPPM